jgi:VWFA-related protein
VRNILIAACLFFFAQQPPSPPQFKTGINLVEVDAVVTDRSGRPVRGLKKEDFEVFEDGKLMEVVTFTAVDIPEAPADSTIPPPDRSGSASAANDQPEDGRVILVVLDDYHVAFDGGRIVAAKAVVRRLVERLGPSDQAAVIATSGNSAMQAEFTSDKARLMQAVDKFFPQSESSAPGIAGERRSAPPAQGFGFVREIKARWAMETLSNAAKTLALIPHRRKAVLLVSQGLPMSLEQIIRDAGASGASQAMRDFILTAQRSNVAVYPVDPCGLPVADDAGCSKDTRDNLRSIAEGTGGFAVLNTNAPERGVERMVAENGTYYLMGYYSPAAPYDGRRHRIQVRAREKDLQVRAREGYVSPRRAAKAEAASTPVEEINSLPIQSRGLTMRVTAVPAPFANAGGSTIVLGLEVPTEMVAAASPVEFNVLAIDKDGKVRERQRFTSSFTPVAGAPARGWARLGSRIDVAPGRYQVRVAAMASNGVRGSVFTEVDVPKFNSDLAVGGLSLASEGAVHAAREAPAGPSALLTPIPSRELSSSTRIVAQLPIKVPTKKSGGTIAIRATLTQPDGTSLVLENVSRAASDHAGAAGQVYRVPLPASLPPGAYRLAIEATLGRDRATRELAFRIAPPQ